MNGPSYPNPTETSNTQLDLNKKTGQFQQELNMVDQSTPWGNINYTQNGQWADGTPRFQSNTSLNPQLQSTFNNVSQLGQNVSQNLLNKPFSLDTSATEGRLRELASSRLDPALQRRREGTEQSLFNRGVRPGSEAYRRGMEAVTQGENDAYNELFLNGRAQATNELLTERNQPLNELISLMSGTQISQPQFQPTPQSGVAPVDYSGQVQNQFNQQQKDYQNLWGGVGSIGSTLGGWFFSDKSLKENVEPTGETNAEGDDLHTWNYKGSPLMHVGVIAQEVAERDPDRVRIGPNGKMQVRASGMMTLGMR